jgi:AbrB family looped-hinge helix DNA binding protein
MDMAKVSAKGWVVIPRRLRERYGIKPGSLVRFVDYAGALVIVPQRQDAVEAAHGALRRPGEQLSWTRAYLEDKRQERDREERGLEQDLCP